MGEGHVAGSEVGDGPAPVSLVMWSFDANYAADSATMKAVR
jgi:hypothetical protein